MSYLMRHIVRRQLAQHVLRQPVDDGLPRLAHATSALFGLYVRDGFKDIRSRVTLVPDGKSDRALRVRKANTALEITPQAKEWDLLRQSQRRTRKRKGRGGERRKEKKLHHQPTGTRTPGFLLASNMASRASQR